MILSNALPRSTFSFTRKVIHIGGVKKQKTKDPLEVQRREEEKQAREDRKKGQSKGERVEHKIVRLLSTDLDGNRTIVSSLRSIKGVSFSFAKIICTVSNIDPKTITSELTEAQLGQIEEVIRNPNSHNIPTYLLNNRQDIYTGENQHLVGTDLDVWLRQRLSELKKYNSYRGWRHRLGQPVRGQRTRSSFRVSRSVGVVKKKAAQGR